MSEDWSDDPEQIRESISNLNHSAKRCFQVVGKEGFPSIWDKRHAQINGYLDDLEAVTA